MKVIDLRSDTVTRPSPRDARRHGRGRSRRRRLRRRSDRQPPRGAGRRDARQGSGALRCSGTQSNLLALLAHCERGDEYIVGQQAHTYKYEGGGAAVLGSIQPQPLDYEAGRLAGPRQGRGARSSPTTRTSRARGCSAWRTRRPGKALPLDYLSAGRRIRRARKGLGLHLDGARIFNAAVASGRSRHRDQPATSTRSRSACRRGWARRSDRCCAASRELIAKARRWRKVLGGGMRQAGVLAAAGIYALEHNVERLAEDHENARALAEGLAAIDGSRVAHGRGADQHGPRRPRAGALGGAARSSEGAGHAGEGQGTIRLVTHLDVDRADIDRFVGAVRRFFAGRA